MHTVGRTLDPFFPEWMEWLGFPHFEFFDGQFENVMFELVIITYIVGMAYCEWSAKKHEPERKKREALAQKQFEDILRSHGIKIPKK